MSQHVARILRIRAKAAERVDAPTHGGPAHSRSDGLRAVRVDEPVAGWRRGAFGVVGIPVPPRSRQRPGAS
jgi:hypothetical protein